MTGYAICRRPHMSTFDALLKRNFDAKTLERGRQYWREGRVLEVERISSSGEAIRLESSVEGSDDEPYTQEIRVKLKRGDVDGGCSCPVGSNCKHVVAALLQANMDEPLLALDDEPSLLPQPAPDVIAAIERHRVERTNLELPLPYGVEAWLLNLARAVRGAADEGDELPADVAQRLLYIFEPPQNLVETTCSISLRQARVLKSGEYSGVSEYSNPNALINLPRFMSQRDARVLRQLAITQRSGYAMRFDTLGMSAKLIEDIIATGRAYWRKHTGPRLHWGVPRAASVSWETLANGDRRAAIIVNPAATMLASEPVCYVDTESGLVGEANTSLNPAIAAAIVAAPVLPVTLVERVNRELQQRNLHHVVAPSQPLIEKALADYQPVPVLKLQSTKRQLYDARAWKNLFSYVDTATLKFDYLGELVSGKNPAEITRVRDGAPGAAGVLERAMRNANFERDARALLRKSGLDVVERALKGAVARTLTGSFAFAGAEDEDVAANSWMRWMREEAPRLRAAGWVIEIDRDFRFDVVDVDGWYANVDEAKNHWFDLEVGIEIDGARVSLIPILLKAIRLAPEVWTPAALAAQGEDGLIIVPLPDNRRVALPVVRVRGLLATLYELYSREPGAARVRLSTLDAARLAELDQSLQLRWVGGERLRAMGNKLARFTGLTHVAPPKDFHAKLRDYQQDGLNWLQFLREYELAGVLADDMGLGKTVQTLAHIATEKAAGRLTKPALVVAPTSMMTTWKAEAERFAPNLNVWVSHGSARHAGTEKFGDYDVVLTTYALLTRDEKALKKQPWYMVILDEAQNIKNPKTKAAMIAAALKAQHRLCLSGTPLENHLGELWSLFNFLLPGFLADEKTFTREFRKPIEKENDIARRQYLARRIKPFLLRRTKDMVASELPAKTIVTRMVDFDAAQADLYETVRAAMDQRVEEEIAAKGLARSHIVVLDALLKLRQICCDPRLFKTAASKKPAPSAKLDALMEMLTELIDEGRSILLFSQFSSMLELIEAELDERKIPYVKLTGATRDRKTPVEQFQAGAVKLFLISLKAGGTGLTLTAADTVIHYDPWWNPAAENQATDRAHRIGQTKPVFVYKLVVAGSVEERIVEMQTRKGALAAGLLEGDGKALTAIDGEDLKSLFAPISET
jgi:superfamily II DNA or RNA helicase